MFSTMLPINIKENTDKNAILQTLQKVGAKYAILSFDDVILSAKREKYEKKFAQVAEIIPFLKSHGYRVGIYFWSLWLTDIDADILEKEVMVSSAGKLRVRNTALNSTEKQYSGYLCPTSEKTEIMLDIIRCAASYQPDLILLNDDLGFATYLGGIGCYCHRHLSQIRERLGYDITREQLREAVSQGKRNDIRTAWLEIQGASIENYAKKIRAAIDSVDPAIRCGFCCVMSNWSADGVSVEKVTKLLAGNTQPLLRTIGAPYWGQLKAWGNRLQHTVELTRMETSWIQDAQMELIAEGDVYPRPRHNVPASFLEHYHTALLAAGCSDGIFKIMLDYNASLRYETGYVDRHVKNQKLYSEIGRIFGDKTATGVRVYEAMNKAEDADFTGIEKPEEYATNLFFSYAARFLTDNSVPTMYEGNHGVGIAFGENARHLPGDALENGLILDIRAAKILMEQGIDVGIESVGDFMLNNFLYFPDQEEKILSNYWGAAAYEITPKPGARVVTYSQKGDDLFPDAIEYENASGQRFLVYAFDGAFVNEGRYRNYCTQLQLFGSLKWLAGKKMPAVCLGNPDLYVICKEDETTMAIGLWNMFPDEILEPVITLSDSFKKAEFINCQGVLERNTIRLSPIPAYGFAFVRLEK